MSWLSRSGSGCPACAVDQADHTQPGSPVWNRQGYGNNAVQDVNVTVTG